MNESENKLIKSLAKEQSSAGEMTFLDHIEALRWHIVRALAAVIFCAIIVFVNIKFIFDQIILGPAKTDFIAYRALCRLGKWLHLDSFCLQSIQVDFQNVLFTGQFMLSLSSSMIIGLIVAFPYVFWEFWRFLKPALKRKELQYAKGIVLWSSLLFASGVLFGYFVVAPFTINFFAGYQLSEQFKNIITISSYYDAMSSLILGMGLVFELPILVYFLSRVGILTPKFMRKNRRYAIFISFVVAAFITPPDGFSLLLVAIPLMILYEASILLSARVQKDKAKKEMETLNW